MEFPRYYSTVAFTLLSLLIFSVYPIELSAQSFVFENKKVLQGTRADFILPVISGKDSANIRVTVLNGAEKGPVFTVSAGIHGYEYAPVMAVQSLYNLIDPTKLKGTLILIPVANEPAFFGRTIFKNPIDGKNLNRVFPGNKNGSLTEKMAYVLNQKIFSISDYYADLHAGDGNEDLLSFACYYDRMDSPEQTNKARLLALAAGFEHNVRYPYNLKNTDKAEYAFKETTQQGIASVSLECGKLGITDSLTVNMLTHGIVGMVQHLNMLEKSALKMQSPKQTWIDKQHYVYATENGIFYSKLKSGNIINKGDSLGYITDLYGNKIADLTSPESGIILYKTGTPPVNKGETMFCIGVL